ncbi:CBS domain-containing protein [Leptospira ognonensis]|uniref:CBS domain-containing protein n=1 Tax=Leptospira ognonensis TaxID=2484945 RepID=A0A4R9JYK9_9LEPT|nr:CBS domain-containing protein [Leptospira ognonensis]TGL56698.1 CBS domain-containing protein [Leptospira ognonensis]
MFFWVQNGILTPRLPAVSKPTVPKIHLLSEGHGLQAFDPDEEAPLAANTSHIFQNPKSAYTEEQLAPENETSPLLFANQLMSSPVTTLPSHALVSDAKLLFLEKRFRHIPVVNEKQVLIGIVSDRDVLRSVAIDESPSNILITEIMTERVLSGSLQTEIRYAAKVMLDEKVGSLPILDSSGEIIGIITRTDLIRAIVKFPGFTLLA